MKKAYCLDGPCKGKVFSVKVDSKELIIVTPENPFYEKVSYRITSQETRLGEFIAMNIFNTRRRF